MILKIVRNCSATRRTQINAHVAVIAERHQCGLDIDDDLAEMRTRFLITKGVAKLGEREMLVQHGADTHRDTNDAQMPANPDENADPLVVGANTGLLTNSTMDCGPYSAMPRMSSIPVNINLIERRSI